MESYLLPEDDGLPMGATGKWSVQKLDYLKRYIEIFETAMRKKWKYRIYIDLFTGAGKNLVKGSKQVFLGSPLVALTTKFPFTHYIFCDNNDEYTDALRERCSVSSIFENVDVHTGDCNTIVDKIVPFLKQNQWNSLNMAFLDPFGLKDLSWDTVAKLASIRRMDLIIYYPQMGITRYKDAAFESDSITAIDRFFGTTEWRDVYKSYRNKPGQHKAFVDLYKEQLSRLGYTQVFRGDEDFGEPLIRNQSKNAPLYRLIFASKDNLGYKFWREVLKRDVFGQRRLF